MSYRVVSIGLAESIKLRDQKTRLLQDLEETLTQGQQFVADGLLEEEDLEGTRQSIERVTADLMMCQIAIEQDLRVHSDSADLAN